MASSLRRWEKMVVVRGGALAVREILLLSVLQRCGAQRQGGRRQRLQLQAIDLETWLDRELADEEFCNRWSKPVYFTPSSSQGLQICFGILRHCGSWSEDGVRLRILFSLLTRVALVDYIGRKNISLRTQVARFTPWMDHFKREEDASIRRAAFVVYWLSKCVFGVGSLMRLGTNLQPCQKRLLPILVIFREMYLLCTVGWGCKFYDHSLIPSLDCESKVCWRPYGMTYRGFVYDLVMFGFRNVEAQDYTLIVGMYTTGMSNYWRELIAAVVVRVQKQWERRYLPFAVGMHFSLTSSSFISRHEHYDYICNPPKFGLCGVCIKEELRWMIFGDHHPPLWLKDHPHVFAPGKVASSRGKRIVLIGTPIAKKGQSGSPRKGQVWRFSCPGFKRKAPRVGGRGFCSAHYQWRSAARKRKQLKALLLQLLQDRLSGAAERSEDEDEDAETGATEVVFYKETVLAEVPLMMRLLLQMLLLEKRVFVCCEATEAEPIAITSSSGGTAQEDPSKSDNRTDPSLFDSSPLNSSLSTEETPSDEEVPVHISDILEGNVVKDTPVDENLVIGTNLAQVDICPDPADNISMEDMVDTHDTYDVVLVGTGDHVASTQAGSGFGGYCSYSNSYESNQNR
uniref:Aminotransferase-like plant mobile domain-containing protein n=1 Tax=Fagus sylvatica TaxID=28930 RepID=A0A2N9GR74_FAGSY